MTRVARAACTLADPLIELGATVHVVPLTRIELLDPAPLRAAIERLEAYRWIVLTSGNAARIFADELALSGGAVRMSDSAARRRPEIVAVGPATARTLRAAGLAPDIIAADYSAEGVLAELRSGRPVRGQRVLYPVARGARDVLVPGLEALGATVDAIPIYESVPDDAGAARLRGLVQRAEIDLVAVMAGSAVRAVVRALGTEAMGVHLASIGPVTSQVARELGLRVDVEATQSTAESLVAAIVARYGRGSASFPRDGSPGRSPLSD
ncbi:MAG: uroporphyrinogen-III synthase [Gemmatimonadaceae bacterium]